ncbi:DUF4145 domain-containing protein [Streptomyces sp. NPDC048332]|uniref:DUF4145 domain-containing protein n=1 Tax=Streptomyces sp. NPDC048332 TaxID=3154619 RepID=UPI00343439D7
MSMQNVFDAFRPKSSGECPHCHHRTSFTQVSRRRVYPSPNEPMLEIGEGDTVEEKLLACDFCRYGHIVLRSYVGEIRLDENEEEVTIATGSKEWVLWPQPPVRPLPSEAPQLVRELFEEAAKAEQAGAFRLAGVGYRAVVEQIAKDRGATGRNLYEQITTLGILGVDADVVNDFHEARLVGNDSVHDALAYSAEEIADIAGLIESAVLTLYVQPAQRARMAADRAARRAEAKAARSAT